MLDFIAGVGVILAFVFLRLGEAGLHKTNYEYLVFAGAEEKIPRLMDDYYWLEWVFIIAAAVEFLFFQNNLNFYLQVAAIALLILAAGTRLWAISSLGSHWTKRCIYISGYPKVYNGPYKFLRHPEYLARLGEVLGVGLFLGTYAALGIVLVMQLGLLRKIMAAEREQLVRLTANSLG